MSPATRVRDDVAVILCTYNGAAHLADQVASILEQDVLPGELRVHDDGSSDGSVEVVRRTWAARGPAAADVRLHVADAPPASAGAAQNFARAAAAAPQPILAFSDQDDVWLPDRLRATLALLDGDPAAEVVGSNATMTDADGAEVGRTVFEAQRLTRRERQDIERGDPLPALIRRNLLPGMTLTLRRSLMTALGPLPDGAMHDYWVVAAAAARGTLRIVPRPLVRYRIHGGNAVGLDTGTRSLRARTSIRLRALRAPLTDLPQWDALPARLRQAGDPDAASRLAGKRAFELRRRHDSRSPLRRAATAAQLLAGTGYADFEFQGGKAAVRDALRRRDPYLDRVGAQ